MPHRKPSSYQERNSRLIALFFFAAVLLNLPMLGVLGSGEKLGSIPALFIYLGLVWVGLIVLLWLSLRDAVGDPSKKKPL